MIHFLEIVAGILAGGILGYAFRGKEHAEITKVGAEVKAVEQKVVAKL